MRQNEQEVRQNQPIQLWSKCKVPVANMVDADGWLDKASEVEDMEAPIVAALGDRPKMRLLRRAYNEALYACVLSYPGMSEISDEVKQAASSEQLAHAFVLLKEVTDPFDIVQSHGLKVFKERSSAIPPDLARKLLAINITQP